jgi:MFS family permease
MSLINTNYNYLATMGIPYDSPLVGVIVSVYYLGCAVGAVLASRFADDKGRKAGIFACLVTSSLGNLLMFGAGMGDVGPNGALATMMLGRIILGLGVGTYLVHHLPGFFGVHPPPRTAMITRPTRGGLPLRLGLH